MSRVEDRLAALGLTVPTVVPPVAAYQPAVVVDNVVYVSGQLPLINGELPVKGKVGAEVTAEQAYELAKQCGLNLLAALKSVVDLDSITRIAKVGGFVASAPDFTGQPQVINGASELLGEAFGDTGTHARSAVGVPVLPLDTPVEVDLIAHVR
ncbi:RidA family protein [Nesterenkonia alkaliphila]|uniref:RidA family protein n=1 Tax=Nesterenkonia alkaliphila TaxID=1463631 RepID=A0A7K1UI26_9MICC|nr:RidA family protein [Nesterenkonia alkaliphila]MVT26034.1 RidA family protein [Nesterenkonia alkaliphila]GFZ86222.1 LysR family transcriptional regulator [Nesterenkonia alkaliphila]